MALMVPDEVRGLFQVLTGEEWPDANEDKLRALADAWDTAANRLTGELAPNLRTAVAAIRANFQGQAEQAFADRMAPFVEGADNFLSIADTQFHALGTFLRDLALEVEYVKLVSILQLITLIAEMAWAIANSFFTAGASMAWLAARVAIVEYLLKSLLGRLLIMATQALIFGIAFQLVIDVLAQLIQFATGSRTQWNPKYTATAAAVGALGGALTVPLAGFGKAITNIGTGALDDWLGKIPKGGRDWHAEAPETITNIGIESFHETLTEALYEYITTGNFELNPFAATSGAASGSANAGGTQIGVALGGTPRGASQNNGEGTRSGGDGPNATGTNAPPGPSTPGTALPGNGFGPGNPVNPMPGNGFGPGNPGSAVPGNGFGAGNPPGGTPGNGFGGTSGNGLGTGAVGGVGSRGGFTGPSGGTPGTPGTTRPDQTIGPNPTPAVGSNPQLGTPSPVGSTPPAVTEQQGGGVPSITVTPPVSDPAPVNDVGTPPVGGAPAVGNTPPAPVGQQLPASGIPATTGPGTAGGPVGPAQGGPGSPSIGSAATSQPLGPTATPGVVSGSAAAGPSSVTGGSPTAPPASAAPVAPSTNTAAVPPRTTPPVSPTLPTSTAPTIGRSQTVAPPTAIAQVGYPNKRPRRVPPVARPNSVRPVPKALAAAAPGPFSDFTQWVGMINGPRGTINCVDAAASFHSTWRGDPATAGPARATAGTRLDHVPQYLGEGPAAVAEVVRRVTGGGRGSDAIVLTTPPGAKDGHAWNIVNQHGVVSHVDAQHGTWSGAESAPPAGKVWAVVLDPQGRFIDGATISNAGSTGRQPVGDSFGARPPADGLARATQAALDAATRRDQIPDSIRSARNAVRAADIQLGAAAEPNRVAHAAVAATQNVATPLIQQLGVVRGRLATQIQQLEGLVDTENTAQLRANDADGEVRRAQLAVDGSPEGDSAEDQRIARENQRLLTEALKNQSDRRDELTEATKGRRGTQTVIATTRAEESAAHDAARGPYVSAQAAANAARDADRQFRDAQRGAQQAGAFSAQVRGFQQDATTAATNAANLVLDIQREVGAEATLRDSADKARDTADKAAEAVQNLTDQEAELSGQLGELQDQLEAAQSAPAAPTPDAQAAQDKRVADLTAEVAGLATKRDAVRGELAKAPDPAALAETANEAQNKADQKTTEIEQLLRDVAAERDNASTAAQNAVAAAQSAANAAQATKTAADAVKAAAAQGEVERGLTLLGDVPFADRIVIERRGPTDGVTDSVANLFGDNTQDVADRAGQAAADAVDEHLGTIINQGHEITVSTPAGDVRVLLTGRPERPGDTRKAPVVALAQPDVIKTDRSDTQTPVAVSTSRSLPLRIPLITLTPVVDGAPVLRPLGSAGFVAKRSQGMTSMASDRPGVRTGDRPWVNTQVAITATRIGTATSPATSTVDAGMRVPAVVPSPTTPAALPQNGRDRLPVDAVRVPLALTDQVTTQVGAGHRSSVTEFLGSPEVLHMRAGGTARRQINSRRVDVAENGPPQISLVGPANKVDEQRTAHTASSAITKGSEATAGVGLGGGEKNAAAVWFVGLFTDFSSQRVGGYNRGIENAVERNSTQPELVYQVDRPVTVTVAGGPPVTETVTELVTVPVPLAAELGLPIPPHLSPNVATPRPVGTQSYLIGTDDIVAVPRAQAITDFLNEGLDNVGQAAVIEKFNGDKKITSIYNALHGGEQVTWTTGGRNHTLDVYAIIRPPGSSFPSGQSKTTVQDQVTSIRRRTDRSERSAKVGAGGEFRPVGKDTPKGGAQAAPTSSRSAPRVIVSGAWEHGRSTAVGTSGRDGRITAYAGDYRGFDGDLDLVVVHREVPTPNWFQRIFLGGVLAGGLPSADRLTEPPAATVNTARSGQAVPDTPGLRTHTVPAAITVSVPVDKFAWSDKQIPGSGLNPAIYLGTAPTLPAGTTVIDPALFGEFAGVEHVRVTPNTTEGLHIALAKSVAPVWDPLHPPPPAPVVRRSPWAGRMWSSWGTRQITESARGTANSVQYAYRLSDLTKPGTAPGDAIQQFVSQVGSRGTATLGLNGETAGPHKLIQPGRLTDLNGVLAATADYSSPRVVDVRKDGTLQRRQDGDLVVNNGDTRQWGVDVEVAADVLPRRATSWGNRIRLAFGGNLRWGNTNVNELTSGGRQLYNYKGPTVWLAMDVRYTYTGDVNIRNGIKTAQTETVPVTVDEPDGILVQLPAITAADLFTANGLPVPPEITAVLPAPPTVAPGGNQTLLQQPGGYISHGTTTVFASRLHGPDPLGGARDRLTEIGVTGKWQTDVVERINELLTSPRGHLALKDVLSDSGVISIPKNTTFYSDVVDVRVTATPTAPGAGAGHPAPATTPLVPNSQTTYSYISTTNATQKTGSHAWNVGLQNDLVHRTEQTKINPDGTKTKVPGSKLGMLGLFTGIGRQVANVLTLPGSRNLKPMRLLTFDKLDRSSHDVTYSLEISRIRTALPAADALTVTAIRAWNRNIPAGTPIPVDGSVDLVAPKPAVSPPMAQPAQPPTFDVLAQRPAAGPRVLDPDAMWHVESLGEGTAKAIRNAAYAQLGDRPLPVGDGVAALAVQNAASQPSTYASKGTTSEYALHTMTTGTALHNGGWSMFSGDTYTAKNVLGAKHILYDDLFDLRIAAEFRPGSFRLLPPPPAGAKIDHGRETEDVTLTGASRIVTWNRGVAGAALGGGTTSKAGTDPLSPASVVHGTTPIVGASSGISIPDAWSNGTFDLTVISQGGRSYLFDVDADFYLDVDPHHSNWMPKAGKGVRDFVAGRGPSPRTVHIGSTDDVRVRVWEADALRSGLITVAEVWQHGGKSPGSGLAVGPSPDGAVLHPAGTPAGPHAATVPATPDDRGRTLHVDPGVTRDQVVDFVAGLPAEMRPHTFTVPAGGPFTGADLTDAIAARSAPPAVPASATPAPRDGRLEVIAEEGPSDPGPSTVVGTTDGVGAPWSAGARTLPTAPVEITSVPPSGSHGTKRSRDDFESDTGPVTRPEPRDIPATLAPPSAAAVHALQSLVPPGSRFTDPHRWVNLINGERTAPGRDVNCVDAVMSFHSTYHGQPRVAGASTTATPPTGAVSQAAEWSTYAPEYVGTGPAALAEVIDRINDAGPGADALVFAYGAAGGTGHAWNVVNHNGSVLLADPQRGTIVPATPTAIDGLGRVHAIPLDANNQFIPPASTPGVPHGLPSGIATDFAQTSSNPDPDWAAHLSAADQQLADLLEKSDGLTGPAAEVLRAQLEALALHLRDVDTMRMRAAAAKRQPIPLRGSAGTLVPEGDGYRLLSDTPADPGLIAELAAAILLRDIIAIVVGADPEEPRSLRFPPRGRPLPVEA